VVTAASVSVLMPSRGRPAALLAAINSLKWNACYPANVEVLVAADPDDQETVAVARIAKAWQWTAPERYGYARLHEYYNRLAGMAHGEWLLLWNDDAIMVTEGWDGIIRGQDPAVLWLGANHHHTASMFPAWPRAWAQATGHVSPVPHCDTFLQHLGEVLGLLVKVPVEVRHDRADVTGANDDATYAEGRGVIGPCGMVDGFDPQLERATIMQDVPIIQQLLHSERV
jgi:hypothetical protein